MPHKRLFIPGPTEVRTENLFALAKPQVGHRSKEFQDLYARVLPKLKKVIGTDGRTFLFTCSSTGVWEAAIRNCVPQRVLCCMQGAFSDRWLTVAEANGKQADALRVEWGKAITAEAVDEALSKAAYDAITVVHNETSTGVMNRLDEIAAVVRKYPDTLFLVDSVSAMAGAPTRADDLGIDVCLAGLQKAFALPAGLAVCSVSQRAMARAETVKDRGYYFDFLEMAKYDDRGMTPRPRRSRRSTRSTRSSTTSWRRGSRRASAATRRSPRSSRSGRGTASRSSRKPASSPRRSPA